MNFPSEGLINANTNQIEIQQEAGAIQQEEWKKPNMFEMETLGCGFCGVTLSFPRGTRYIQCSKCGNTMSSSPQQCYGKCKFCSVTLVYPKNSQQIHCPGCQMSMKQEDLVSTEPIASQAIEAVKASQAQIATEDKPEDKNDQIITPAVSTEQSFKTQTEQVTPATITEFEQPQQLPNSSEIPTGQTGQVQASLTSQEPEPLISINQNVLKQANSEIEQRMCLYCSIHMSFPKGAKYVRCPKCMNTMAISPSIGNNDQTQAIAIQPQTMGGEGGGGETMLCNFCSVQLTFPKGAKYIQCPKCRNTMMSSGCSEKPDENREGGEQVVFCNNCNVQLSYPKGAKYIQCPKCRQTMNPTLPHKTHCYGCGILLAYPPSSLYIQCPLCYCTMNAREKATGLSMPFSVASQAQHKGIKPIRKRKDPNAPKAASNAYMIFCKEKRAQLRLEHPDLPFGQLGAKLGEIWRDMTPERKEPYEDRAILDRQRYREQMEQYQYQAQVAKRLQTQIQQESEDSSNPNVTTVGWNTQGVSTEPLIEEDAHNIDVPTDTNGDIHTTNISSKDEFEQGFENEVEEQTKE